MAARELRVLLRQARVPVPDVNVGAVHLITSRSAPYITPGHESSLTRTVIRTGPGLRHYTRRSGASP